MGQITPSVFSAIAVSQIRNFLNSVTGTAYVNDISIDTMEKRYMGDPSGTGNGSAGSNLCMFGQVEMAANSTGLSPANYSAPTAYTPVGQKGNIYQGSQTAWRPTRFSEFNKAYSPKPSISVAGVATGAKNSTGNLQVTVANGNSSYGGTVYFYVHSGYNTGNWYVGSQTFTNVPNGSSLAAYVVDDRFCGGEYSISASGSYPSDKKLKKDIKPITNALDKIDKISGVTFKWKEQTAMDCYTESGVIAQEIKEVLPEAVEEVDGILRVNYYQLIPLLIQAIKELKNKNS